MIGPRRTCAPLAVLLGDSVGHVNAEIVRIAGAVLLLDCREDKLYHIGHVTCASTSCDVAILVVVSHEGPWQSRIIGTNASTVRRVRSKAQPYGVPAFSTAEVSTGGLTSVVVRQALTGYIDLDCSWWLSRGSTSDGRQHIAQTSFEYRVQARPTA